MGDPVLKYPIILVFGVPRVMTRDFSTMTDALAKWLENPLKNKFCFIPEEFTEYRILFSIAEIVSFYLNLREDGSFFISLPEEEELILDEFERVDSIKTNFRN